MELEVQVRQYFSRLKTNEDFVKLINFVHNNLNKESKIKEIEGRTIYYYAYHSKNNYSFFTIPKKSGGHRSIIAPVPYLKLIQKSINFILQSVFIPHDSAYGFVKSKNIVGNARKHVNKNYVFNLDLEDFFPSVSFRRVKTVLELEPFNLNVEKEEIAFLIANLCCYNGSLPQGAPTSPTITNIVCQRLDRKLSRLAKEYNTKYSRYADDITFSSNNNFHSIEFNEELEKIIREENFNINFNKVRLQDWSIRQEVTGLTVNEKVNINQKYLRTVRAMLNNWDKKGLDYASTIFKKNSNKTKLMNKVPDFEKSLKGKIDFIGMVRGKNDPVYLKYRKQYDRISKLVLVKEKLQLWKTEGLEKAVEIYSK